MKPSWAVIAGGSSLSVSLPHRNVSVLAGVAAAAGPVVGAVAGALVAPAAGAEVGAAAGAEVAAVAGALVAAAAGALVGAAAAGAELGAAAGAAGALVAGADDGCAQAVSSPTLAVSAAKRRKRRRVIGVDAMTAHYPPAKLCLGATRCDTLPGGEAGRVRATPPGRAPQSQPAGPPS